METPTESMKGLKGTNLNLPGQTNFYKGKVRDVYTVKDEYLVMVVSDRLSTFDVVLPKPIPYKGQVLNQIAAACLEQTKDIVPNWLMASPDPNVSVGLKCEPFEVEMVIRGYLTGHAWRTYRDGKRMICGVAMPDGMKEHDRFPEPLLTPTTKATEGHDEDISREEILKQGIVSEADYVALENYTRELFQRGTEMAAERGLILVDTKYEFGKKDGKIFLIDEIHTPDSSRFFYSEGYQQRQDAGEKQKQLSKEFAREWLIARGYMGKEGQEIPELTSEFIDSVTDRYIELFEKITGERFEKADIDSPEARIEANVLDWLKTV